MPADKDLMESKLHVELDNENFMFNSGMRIYENLSGKNLNFLAIKSTLRFNSNNLGI